MIDFTETVLPMGGMRARVRAGDLPDGMYYHITLWADGKVTSKSRANGNGSVRYYTHRTYDEALAHGFNWAKRKVAEAKWERKKNSETIDEAVRSIQNSAPMRKMASLFGAH